MKKLISFALAVVMIASLFTLCAPFVFAEGEFDAEVLNAEGTKISDLNLSDLKDFGSAGTKMATWDGYTIKLLKDVTTANTVFLVGNITFDGNGHQITFTGTEGNKNVLSVATDAGKLDEGAGPHPSVYKTVKIKNLKATTTGMILIPYFANVEFGDGNDFTAPGNMFYGSRSNGGKLTFTGGKYTNSGSSAIFALDFRTYEVDVRGGEFSTSTAGVIIKQTIDSTVNISGGSFSTSGSANIINQSAGTVNINGGSFSSTNGDIIKMNKAGTINISGGKFVLSGGNVIINMLDTAPGNLNVNIYDGYFYSTSWNRIAAVLAGTMNVYGGIFRNTNRGDGDLFTVRGSAKLNIYGGTIINAAGKDPIQNVNNGLYYPNEAKLYPAMGVGASVRLVEGSNGIRFTSTFSNELIDYVDGMKDVGTELQYGTLILPTNVLNTVNGKSAFNVNTLISSGLEEGKGYVDIIAKDGMSVDESGNVTIRAALVNLKETNYDLELSAVSYNGHHLHNHYCINSVSFVDGNKFENKIAEHMRMREVSDEICKRHRLSVLHDSNFYSKQSKREYWKNKSASEIEKEIIRQDIWEAAYHAKEPNEFYSHLRSLGYYINRNHKYEHISVTPPGWNRVVRIDTLIPELDNNSLLNLFWENYEQYYEPIYVRFDFCPLKKYENTIWRYKHRRDNIQEFVDAIFGIIRLALGLDDCRNKEPRAVVLSPDFRKESAALKERQSIIRFVSKHQIKTPQDIRDVAAECQARMDDLKETRAILYNRIRRPKPTDTVEEIRAARDSLTRDITKARKQLKTANKLLDLLTRLEKEIDEEMVLERSNAPLSETTTADDVSRCINSEDYDPTQHSVPSEKQTSVCRKSDWER